MDLEKKSFYQGFAIACAFIADDHDQPSMAADALEMNGITHQDLIDAEVDDYDIKRLNEALEYLEARK